MHMRYTGSVIKAKVGYSEASIRTTTFDHIKQYCRAGGRGVVDTCKDPNIAAVVSLKLKTRATIKFQSLPTNG